MNLLASLLFELFASFGNQQFAVAELLEDLDLLGEAERR
jgi:hypothetical protein